MGMMLYCLFWVMQDLHHQLYLGTWTLRVRVTTRALQGVVWLRGLTEAEQKEAFKSPSRATLNPSRATLNPSKGHPRPFKGHPKP